MVALAEVAGADVEDAVREADRFDERDGARQQFVEHGRRVCRRGVGEDLHLVELVDAQQSPGVAPRRPRLAPVARRVGHESLRQFGLGVDLVAAHRRERHLGRRDAPEVVALGGVGVVGELGQLTGGGEGGRRDQRGRADLLEGVGVAFEGELAQRPRSSWRRGRAAS